MAYNVKGGQDLMTFKQQCLLADGGIAFALLLGISLLLLIFSSARLP